MGSWRSRFGLRQKTATVAWATAAFVAVPLVATIAMAGPAAAAPTTITFFATTDRQPQSWIVPAGVTAATFDVLADHGKDWCPHTGGLGGETIATIPVTPGETLQIDVGSAYYGSPSFNASEVRRGAFALTDRIIVAGGGGSAADEAGQNLDGTCATSGPGFGGYGGDPDGANGSGVTGSGSPGGVGGGGATQTSGGFGGGSVGGGSGGAGTFGIGGGAGVDQCGFGGFGGYGWYGGGGGGSAMGIDPNGQCPKSRGGGGGGGSSFVEPAGTGVVFHPGIQSPYGSGGFVTITTGIGPSVSGVAPASGPTGGGASVAVSGSGFTGATKVRFGASKATNVVVVSDTMITAFSPAGAAGVVNVRVTTAGGTSPVSSADRYTYDPLPVVSAISPKKGPQLGATVVTITGIGFVPGSTVAFGANPATKVKRVSATELRATSPAGSGTVDVTVTTPGGTSATSSADAFTYR